MPLREEGFKRLEELTSEQRLAIEGNLQANWYRHFGVVAQGKTVLDAGAGVGYGIRLMNEAGAVAEGFDVTFIVPEVRVALITDYAEGSFDYVAAVDVIEHIPKDVEFLEQIMRVARLGVFISTPNWRVSHAVNPFHVREYTPAELMSLTARWAKTCWVALDDRSIVLRGDNLAADEDAPNFGVLLFRSNQHDH